MGLKSAEQVLMFDAFFIVLLTSFGFVVGIQNLNTVQSIPVPPLAPVPSVNCNGLCNPFSGIVTATAYIGWAIVNLPVFLVYFITVVIVFLSVVLGIAFSPAMSPNGVPIIGFLFVAMQLIVVWEAFRTFRGQSVLG
jgi:hypothetical protein